MESPLRTRRTHRSLAAALLATLVAVVLGAAAGSAPAAEPGVVLAKTGAPHIADLRALGTHWVRIFVTWPDIEPAPGDYSAAWLGTYEKLFHDGRAPARAASGPRRAA